MGKKEPILFVPGDASAGPKEPTEDRGPRKERAAQVSRPKKEGCKNGPSTRDGSYYPPSRKKWGRGVSQSGAEAGRRNAGYNSRLGIGRATARCGDPMQARQGGDPVSVKSIGRKAEDDARRNAE